MKCKASNNSMQFVAERGHENGVFSPVTKSKFQYFLKIMTEISRSQHEV